MIYLSDEHFEYKGTVRTEILCKVNYLRTQLFLFDYNSIEILALTFYMFGSLNDYAIFNQECYNLRVLLRIYIANFHQLAGIWCLIQIFFSVTEWICNLFSEEKYWFSFIQLPS